MPAIDVGSVVRACLATAACVLSATASAGPAFHRAPPWTAGVPRSASGTPPWLAPEIFAGDTANAQLGLTVAAADVDGDGYDELLTRTFTGIDPVSGNPDSSAVLVFSGSASGPVTPPRVLVSPEGPGVLTYFGDKVVAVGDVNGDGYADVLVDDERGNDPGDPNNLQFRGTAYLYLGSPDGLSSTPAARLVGDDDESGEFGFSMAGADVNGDGYSDAIISEYSSNPDLRETVFVYYGSPTGLSEDSRTRLSVQDAPMGYGFAVHSAGDVNGDGYEDIIVGAPAYQYGTSGGGAFVYAGSASGIVPEPLAILTGDTPQGDFGYTVTGVGDLDGDGYDDVVVGTDCEPTPTADCEFFSFPGAAWVFHGTATGLSTTADAKLLLASDDGSSAGFGAHIEAAGDVNGDGIPDVAINATQYNGLGAVLVYYGPLTSASLPSIALYDEAAGFSLWGFWFTLGDLNGDGRLDPAVGAPFYSPSDELSGAGAVYAYLSQADETIFSDGFDPFRQNR